MREALSQGPQVPSRPGLLDVMMPDLDGFEVLPAPAGRRVNVPVLFLTARDATDDKVTGLTTGGDDYLIKPFSLEELRGPHRGRAAAHRRLPDVVYRMQAADLVLDEDSHHVARGGVRSPSRPPSSTSCASCSRTRAGCSRGADPRPRVGLRLRRRRSIVETYVAYLRKKLDPHGPRLIQTVRGIGYCLREA